MPVLQLGRAACLRAAVGQPELVDVAREPRDLRHALYRPRHRDRPPAGDPARPEDPRRGRAAHDLPLSDGALVHRHRHGLEVAAQSRHRHPEDRARLGLHQLHLRLDRPAQHRDLLHRHRRDLAIQRLRHGDVPGRPARRRRRDRQGGPDRRRLDLQDLLADHHPADAAGVPVAPSSSCRTSRSRATTWSWR